MRPIWVVLGLPGGWQAGQRQFLRALLTGVSSCRLSLFPNHLSLLPWMQNSNNYRHFCQGRSQLWGDRGLDPGNFWLKFSSTCTIIENKVTFISYKVHLDLGKKAVELSKKSGLATALISALVTVIVLSFSLRNSCHKSSWLLWWGMFFLLSFLFVVLIFCRVIFLNPETLLIVVIVQWVAFSSGLGCLFLPAN